VGDDRERERNGRRLQRVQRKQEWSARPINVEKSCICYHLPLFYAKQFLHTPPSSTPLVTLANTPFVERRASLYPHPREVHIKRQATRERSFSTRRKWKVRVGLPALSLCMPVHEAFLLAASRGGRGGGASDRRGRGGELTTITSAHLSDTRATTHPTPNTGIRAVRAPRAPSAGPQGSGGPNLAPRGGPNIPPRGGPNIAPRGGADIAPRVKYAPPPPPQPPTFVCCLLPAMSTVSSPLSAV
jgi:hypothetical protein